MDSLLERLFGEPQTRWPQVSTSTTTVPIAVYEKDNNLIVNASIPGVEPENIDISVDNGVLTIRGESKLEEAFQDARVYRREYAHGSFARSLRLPEQLDLDKIDAEFKNGFVTITIPSIAEPKSKAIKVPLRSTDTKAKVLPKQGESISDRN